MSVKSAVSNATHQDIARRAGVSRSRVTQVLHGTRASRISEETKTAVLRIAEELNYQPRNVTTHAIGYVLEIDNLDIQNEMLALVALQRSLPARGYRLLLSEIGNDPGSEFSKTLNAKTADGILFARWPSSEQLQNFVLPDVPVVVAANADGIGDDLDQVVYDVFVATRQITRPLLENGHRRICFVTGIDGVKIHRDAEKGFLAAFEEFGIPRSQASFIKIVNPRELAALLQKEMQRPQPPTAVLVLESMRALAVMNHLQAESYCIPQDVSLASVYETTEFEWLRPRIASTSASGPHLALIAAERLIKKIEGRAAKAEKIVIPTQLVPGDSVAPRKVVPRKVVARKVVPRKVVPRKS